MFLRPAFMPLLITTYIPPLALPEIASYKCHLLRVELCPHQSYLETEP